jgi:predicted transcriptional regulator
MKTQPTPIRLSDDERAALKRAADADARPVAAMGRKAIVDWLRANGWLEPQKKAARAAREKQ